MQLTLNALAKSFSAINLGGGFIAEWDGGGTRNVKKLIFVMAATLICSFVYGTGFAAPLVSIDDYDVLPGGTINVSVNLSQSSGFNIDTFSFRVQLSLADLDVSNIQPGNVGLNTTWFQGQVRQTEGDVSFFYSPFFPPKPILSDGELATFNITADITAELNDQFVLTLADVALSQGLNPVDDISISGMDC